MVKVVARNILQAGSFEKVMEIYEELIAKTRQEEGCIVYELFQDNSDPNVVAFIEEWESAAHLEAHMNTEHFKTLVPKAEAFVTDESINVYTKIK